MGRLDDLDALARHGVAVARDDEACQRPIPVVLDGSGHRGRGLAGADDNDPALRARRQMRRHARGGRSRATAASNIARKRVHGFMVMIVVPKPMMPRPRTALGGPLRTADARGALRIAAATADRGRRTLWSRRNQAFSLCRSSWLSCRPRLESIARSTSSIQRPPVRTTPSNSMATWPGGILESSALRSAGIRSC